jgi:hypothetical protein
VRAVQQYINIQAQVALAHWCVLSGLEEWDGALDRLSAMLRICPKNGGYRRKDSSWARICPEQEGTIQVLRSTFYVIANSLRLHKTHCYSVIELYMYNHSVA